jgi:hypothetical protein
LASAAEYDLRTVLQFNTATQLGQCRAVPVNLGDQKGIFLAYCEDAEIDPFVDMFFFPKHRLKFAVYTLEGKEVWKKELGPGVIPGLWFCPVFPFDLNQDGADEIWFVNNIDDDHPFIPKGRRLEQLDARTGKTMAQYRWTDAPHNQRNSFRYREFVFGGYVSNKPVLVTAQGTYGAMALQAWNPDMQKRWEYIIADNAPGARGSHMCPVLDINNDGSDELFWGERCISLDTGKELFCADRDSYRGHSDVIQPILDSRNKRWSLFTCRESDGYKPRVVMFDDQGQRIWSDLEIGHMDMGWAARLGPGEEPLVMAVRIGGKGAGPGGFHRKNVEEFVYDAKTGHKVQLKFSVYCTLPVDFNGDGFHELARGIAEGNGEVLDRTGRVIGKLDGSIVMASKFMNLPGEQVLCYSKDGTISIWSDRNATDNEAANLRYNHPFYKANQRLTACGYNLVNLGGL